MRYASSLLQTINIFKIVFTALICLSLSHLLPYKLSLSSLVRPKFFFQKKMNRYFLFYHVRNSDLPCVILFLCFSVLLLALRLPRLGKRELI